MPKDRSFAHRIHQSNIDRQRNIAYFALRQPAYKFEVPKGPKPSLWERTKTYFKGLWAKLKEIVND